MIDKALIYLALTVSIVALCYAVWVKQHAEQTAEQALQKRELEFVQKFAPKIREMYQGMGMTNIVDHPTNLDELFGPSLETFNQMLTSMTNDDKTTR